MTTRAYEQSVWVCVPAFVDRAPQRALTNWGVRGDCHGKHAPPGAHHHIWPCGARRQYFGKHPANGNCHGHGGQCSAPPGEVCALGGQLRPAKAVANSGNGLLGVGHWDDHSARDTPAGQQWQMWSDIANLRKTNGVLRIYERGEMNVRTR